MRKCCIVGSTLAALLLLTYLSEGQPPAQGVSTLDRLMKLIGQGGVVQNERLYINDRRLYERTGEAWINEVEKLKASVVPPPSLPKKAKKKALPKKKIEAADGRAVAQAIRQLQPVLDDLRGVLADQKKTKEATDDLVKKLAPKGGEISSVVNDALFGPSDEELDFMVRQRRMTEQQAEEYRRLRAQAQGSLIQKVGKQVAVAYANGVMLARRTRPVLERTEVSRHAVVAEVLRPALQARSGPALGQAPLEVKFSAVRFPGGHDRQGLVTLRSRSKDSLSQLTVLLEIETKAGRRFAALYIPRLPPGGSGRFDPLTLSATALKGDAAMEPDVVTVRYAAWCSQFRAENQDAKIISPEEMVSEIRLQAVQPGLVYVSRGGTMPYRTAKELLQARQAGLKIEPERDRRFEITFKQLTPLKQGYLVDVDFVDHQSPDQKSAAQRFRAVFQLPPVKLGRFGEVLDSLEPRFGEFRRPEEKTIVLRLRSQTQEMELHLMRSWRSLDREWSTSRGPAHARRFVPDAEIPAADSPEGIAKDRLATAMKLAVAGQFVEARQAYEKLIADYPGTIWETQANFGLSKLDAMKRARDKLNKPK